MSTDRPGTFFRLDADKKRHSAFLDESYGGAPLGACWLMGSGPSLNVEATEVMKRTAVPVMGMNLAGTGMLRPTFWTAYDPTVRFLKSIYLDAGITKFVHARRATDLVPESSWKVSDCPNLYLFEGERSRGFSDFAAGTDNKIVDWNDTMIQAVEILIRLGFRRLYLVGCEMKVLAPQGMVDCARELGVEVASGISLSELVDLSKQQGITLKELAGAGAVKLYHFEQEKELAAAVSMDRHYFRVSQYLRLCRKALSMRGVELISVTPGSRLNDYFEYQSIDDVVKSMNERFGDPASESTEGRYQRMNSCCGSGFGLMRDFSPPGMEEAIKQGPIQKCGPKNPAEKEFKDEADLLIEQEADPLTPQRIRELKLNPVSIDEEG